MWVKCPGSKVWALQTLGCSCHRVTMFKEKSCSLSYVPSYLHVHSFYVPIWPVPLPSSGAGLVPQSKAIVQLAIMLSQCKASQHCPAVSTNDQQLWLMCYYHQPLTALIFSCLKPDSISGELCSSCSLDMGIICAIPIYIQSIFRFKVHLPLHLWNHRC